MASLACMSIGLDAAVVAQVLLGVDGMDAIEWLACAS